MSTITISSTAFVRMTHMCEIDSDGDDFDGGSHVKS